MKLFLLYRFGAKAAIRETRKDLTQAEINQFFEECQQSLAAITKKIIKRSPLRHSFVYGCASLDPEIMLTDQCADKCNILSAALDSLVQCRWLCGDEADRVHAQYMNITRRPLARDSLAKFSRKDHRLDVFLMEFCETYQAGPELLKFFSLVLCLSHGQAMVERGFSYNKDLMVENMKDRSLIAQRVIRDYLATHCNSDPTLCEITKQLSASARNAHSHYKAALADVKASSAIDKKKEEEKRQRSEAVKEMEERKKRLSLQVQELNEEISAAKRKCFTNRH